MKKRSNISYFSYAFMTLAFMGAVTACVNEEDFGVDSFKQTTTKDVLSVLPTVSESSVVVANTRSTDSDPAVKEKDLNTLDVFVEHVTNGTGDGTFLKQYHLVGTTDKPITENLNKLADRWRQEGLVDGEKYNIYVAVNNSQTKVKDLATFNVAALKALSYDEVTEGIAIVNEANNNITWDGNTTSGNIYKLYNANPGTYRALTSKKEFMMDGVKKNWTPDPTTLDQTFDVTLNRAAAKVVLNVKFDQTFLDMLKYRYDEDKYKANGTIEWVDAEGNPIAEGGQKVEKLATEQVTIDGSPAWKFNNFAFGAHVFDPGTAEGVEVHNSDFNIFHNQSYTGDDKHFQIVTYSYPNVWDEADYATKAPSIVLSVGYTEGDVTNYHYYRVPLVKSTVTSIDRNHIYVINATIATRGSDTHEDVTPIEDIVYNVLPWNDKNNSAAIENNVQSVQHYYFKVNPKVYTLRGDGDQSVILNYMKATGTKVNWKLFTYDSEGNQTAVVANNATNARRAWFYDAEGDFSTTYNDNSGTNWSNNGPTPMGVNIVQSTEGTKGSEGTITVTSTALNNKAIKYIRLRVYLDEQETFDDEDNETMYEDIIIRHFPTDNIQSIEGLWSSYHDPNSSSATTIYTTTDLAEAQRLAEEYNISYTSEEHSGTEYINYTTYNTHAGEPGYSMTGPETVTRQQFAQAITTNANRQAANGQNNARLVDQWYYWGDNPSTTNNQYQADYYESEWTWGGLRYTYYAYANRYRAQYTHTYSYTEYTLELPIASTGDWVDWDASDAANHTGQRTYSYSYTNNRYSRFYAKVYDNGIYQINEQNINGNRYRTIRGSNYEDLTNNHMYVIQISSTSDSYVLGRPYVNQTTHQSQDNVVSPAFMIASQLGAVTQFRGGQDAANAATHCSRYMEVSDGIRYTGWRLPTQAEIGVITSYQNGNIHGVTIPSQYQAMTPVLTGTRYWCLSGNRINTTTNQVEQTGNAYLRCVRDLSAHEVELLNGFDKIQEKYR